MLTIERQLKSKPTIIELKSATTFKQKEEVLERLGGNIQGCIARLKNLIVEIQAEGNVRKIADKMLEYEKVNRQFNKLQDSLAEVDDDSQIFHKILQMNREFIETYRPQELKKKLRDMAEEKQERIRNVNVNEMGYVNQDSLRGQLLAEDKYAVRRRILEQDKADLVQIERLITQIGEIAEQTKIKLEEVGVTIKLGLEKMSSADRNIKGARENLAQANQYQQDTNHKFMCFCGIVVVAVSVILLIIYSSTNKGE